jgi:hypothetical protein
VNQLVVQREARSIQQEMEQSGHPARFELKTRWATGTTDLLRELRRAKPTVVHLSGHGDPTGLQLRAADGHAQVITAEVLGRTFRAARAPVKLLVLRASYSEQQAEQLLAHVDCVVWMSGAIDDETPSIFSLGFYGALLARESVAVAYEQGRAALELEGLRDGDRVKLKVRDGIDPTTLVLAAGRARNSRPRRISAGRAAAGCSARPRARKRRRR